MVVNNIKVLHVVGGYPSEKNPQEGIFIKNQIDSLINEGVVCDVFVLKGRGFLKYIKGIYSLKKYLKYKYYDIIHAHYMYCGWTARLATKKPVIVSFMGTDVFGRSNKKGKDVLYSKIIHNVLSNLLCSKIQFAIVKSKKLTEILKTINYKIIPNGIDLDKFKIINISKVDLKLNNSKKYILFSGTKKRTEKRYFLALKSVKELEKRQKNVKLITVNGLKQEEFIKYLNVVDSLLLTSQHEGSPNIVKEALACNLPVVSVAVGDVSERLEGVDNCYIVESNPKDIAEKLYEVIKSNSRSNNGRESISNLRIENVAKEIKLIYSNILLNLFAILLCVVY